MLRMTDADLWIRVDFVSTDPVPFPSRFCIKIILSLAIDCFFVINVAYTMVKEMGDVFTEIVPWAGGTR